MQERKQKILLSCLLLVLVITIVLIIIFVNNSNNKEIDEPQLFKEVTYRGRANPNLYYELEDRYIYVYDKINSIKFTYNRETKELKDWFKNDKDFLNRFVNELKKLTKEKNEFDGGSITYHDGNIGIVVCNTLDKNLNIYIGKDLDYQKADCNINKKELVTKKAKKDKIVNIIDKTKYFGEKMNIECNSDKEYFYKDKNYKYSFECRDDNIIVLYKSGYEELATKAIINNDITLKDLDKYKIAYIKEENS